MAFLLPQGIGRPANRQRATRLPILVHEALLECTGTQAAPEERAERFEKPLTAAVIDEAIELCIERKALTLLVGLCVQSNGPAIPKRVAQVAT